MCEVDREEMKAVMKKKKKENDCSDFRNVDLRELLPEYRIEPSTLAESPSTTYDLISNVVHDGEPGNTSNRMGFYRLSIF